MFGKEKKAIKFRAIIELMGRPPAFLTETLNKVVENIETEAKLKILKKEIFEPKETAEKDIYSNFIELELEAMSLEKIIEFISDYLPSNVELISPSELAFNISEFNAVMHNFISKLHSYDCITKKTGFENMMLKKQIGELMPIKIVENSPHGEELLEKKSKKDKKE